MGYTNWIVQGYTESVREVDVSGTEDFFAATGDRHVTLWGYNLL